MEQGGGQLPVDIVGAPHLHPTIHAGGASRCNAPSHLVRLPCQRILAPITYTVLFLAALNGGFIFIAYFLIFVRFFN